MVVTANEVQALAAGLNFATYAERTTRKLGEMERMHTRAIASITMLEEEEEEAIRTDET